jgi:hypothetical protein
MSSTLLQLYLLFLMLVIGVLATIAFQHAYAHFWPVKHPRDTDKQKAAAPSQTAPGGHLPAAVKERLLEASEASFQAVLDKSATDLQHDLDKTAGQLNAVLQKIGAEVVGNEMERYRLQLDEIRKQAATAIGSAQDDIGKHQADLKAKLEEEQTAIRARLAEEIATEKQRVVEGIIAEKQQLAAQIDTKLADAVASFLLESLGHNVDLGAQASYLTAQLQEHKDDFKRSVSE